MSATTDNEKPIIKDKLIQICQESKDLNLIRNLIYDECQSYLNGVINLEHLINLLIEIIKINEDVISILTDLLLLFDIETLNIKNKNKRDNYLSLLSSCSNRLISDNLLKERLDIDTIGDASIITNKKLANTKFIKLKTRLFYKQRKFNLFREESEGYSKLITELITENNLDVDYMLEVVQSLIGCFNLDPNRVIDIILECFECNTDLHKFYIGLIKRFFNNKSSLTQIIAFKFNFYHNDVNLITNQNLYQVTAILIKNKLIDLEDIWDYLLPTDKNIYEFYFNELEDTRKNSRKATLASANNDETTFIDKLEPLLKHSLVEDNQKLNLCLHLLKVGDWQNGLKIIDKLPEFYALSDRLLALELCKIIHFMIDDFYKKNSTLPHSISSKLKPFTHNFGDSIHKIITIDELKDIIFMLLINKLGPFIHHDVLLMIKIVRIGKSLMCLNELTQNQIKYNLITLLDECILPALSFVDSNYGLSEEIWQLMKCFSYPIRYTLYHNLKTELPNSTSIRNRASIIKKIKYIMKRLTKENIRLFGRHIGKLTHSNPSILFEYILSQIQSYDNLIGPVVDSFKYLTSMSYDVLIYCIVEALGDPAKQKTSPDGLTISQWLLSLATFCGSIVKKYPVELPGLLQFIANQLKMDKSLDLFILKEIIQKMAGICFDEMTDDQLLALSGGEVLKNEGGYFNHQVRNTKKSSLRLKEALLESNLAMPLCILIAQQRNCIVFVEQDHTHLKLIGKLYDQCQETLVQYGSFLSSNLSMDDYIGGLPSLDQLIQEYYLSSDVAFFLIRSMITYKINQKSIDILKTDIESLNKQDKLISNNNDKQDEDKQITTTSTDKYKTKFQAFSEAWETIFDQTVNSINKVVNKKLWEDLSPRFFVTFWTLTTYDLEVPKISYEKEIDRLRSQIQLTEENRELAQSKKKKEIDRYRALQNKLLEEQLNQEEHVKKVLNILDKDKQQWFQPKVQKMEMTTQFLQHCLIPRCIFTPNDAIYCAEFVHLLHTIRTPNFSTLICYDRIFGDISYTMSSFTENEANNFGRFLCTVLKTVMTWHKDKNVFDKECAKYPGFVSKFCEKDPVHVDYESYRHVCHKWHYRLTKAFIVCLDSGIFLQIRNALIVLTRILPYLPVITSFGLAIEKRVDQIKEKEKEKRPDLYALATGYSGQLKQKKSTFITEDKFHIKTSKVVDDSKKEDQSNAKKESNTVKNENPSSNKSSPSTKESSSNKKESNNKAQSEEIGNGVSSNDKRKTESKIELSKSDKIEKSDKKKLDKTEKLDKSDKSEKNGKLVDSKSTTDKKIAKTESRSATNSPKREYPYQKSEGDSDREHKRLRKSETMSSRSHNHHNRDYDKKKMNDNYGSNKEYRFTDSPHKLSYHTPSINKSSSSNRKRELNGDSPSNDNKRRRDDELKSNRKIDDVKQERSSRSRREK